MTISAIRRATPVDLTLLALTMLIWAGAFVGIKIAVPAVGPVGVAAARAVIGLFVLAPFFLLSSRQLPRSASQWALLIVMAELNVAIPFTLISYAELTVTAGVASLMMGTGPLFAMIGAHYFTVDDRMNGKRAIGVAMGFAGIALVVGPDAFAEASRTPFVPLLALVTASLCYVVSGLLVRRIDLPPLSMAITALAISSISLLPIALLQTDASALTERNVLAALLFLGVLPTGLAYILRFHLIGKIGYATFALSVNMIPVFGVLLGVVLLGEVLTPSVVAALLLIVGGLAIARSGSRT